MGKFNKLKKMKWLVYVGIAIILAVYVLIESVNLNPLYIEGALFYCVAITAYVAVWALLRFGSVTLGNIQKGERLFNYESKQKFPKVIKALIIIPWAFVAVMIVFSSPLISWGKYRDQLGDYEVKKFSSDMQVMDVAQIPVVDQPLAYNLAGKKLGEKPSLGSQVVLGEPTIQQVNDKLVWIVPLHHSGFFKWITNLSGSPGYIVVSATNVNDVEYVENFKIKYQPNLYLFDDLERYSRFNGGLFTGITDYSFEIDDSGNPFWVITTYHNEVGFSLPEADGILLLNASSGEIVKYRLADVPDWVDRVQPENFIMNQINNKGEYVNGIFNFADKDKLRTSKGEIIVYNEGKCYMFTGLTSVGSDESAVGFVMVDMVSKQPLLFQMSGATEYAAQASAEGKVQHLRYKASFPLILNHNGEPAYFMTLKDQAGLIKQYAFVSVPNFSIVGTGETIQAAIKDFDTAMQNSGSSLVPNQSTEKKTISGKILRISSEFNGTDTVYKAIIAEIPNKLFIINSDVSKEIAITQIGDNVNISYYDNTSGVVIASDFDNMDFTQN